MEDSTKKNRGKIMQNGYKTKSRSYIMDFFEAHKEQIVSAADIHHYLEENGKQVNLATIYRNLDKMTEEGILLKYKTGPKMNTRSISIRTDTRNVTNICIYSVCAVGG